MRAKFLGLHLIAAPAATKVQILDGVLDVHPQQLIIFGVAAVLFVVLMGWRMRRMMTATPFNPYRAWMIPLVFIVFLGLSISRAWPTSPLDDLWIALAAVVGAGFGWLRGKSIGMTYDPVTRQVFAKGGAMAMVFIVGLIIVRTAANLYLHAESGELHLRPAVADAIFSAIGAGLFIARSVEMAIRGHGILVANRGVAPTAPVVDVP